MNYRKDPDLSFFFIIIVLLRNKYLNIYEKPDNTINIIKYNIIPKIFFSIEKPYLVKTLSIYIITALLSLNKNGDKIIPNIVISEVTIEKIDSLGLILMLAIIKKEKIIAKIIPINPHHHCVIRVINIPIIDMIKNINKRIFCFT